MRDQWSLGVPFFAPKGRSSTCDRRRHGGCCQRRATVAGPDFVVAQVARGRTLRDVELANTRCPRSIGEAPASLRSRHEPEAHVTPSVAAQRSAGCGSAAPSRERWRTHLRAVWLSSLVRRGVSIQIPGPCHAIGSLRDETKSVEFWRANSQRRKRDRVAEFRIAVLGRAEYTRRLAVRMGVR